MHNLQVIPANSVFASSTALSGSDLSSGGRNSRGIVLDVDYNYYVSMWYLSSKGQNVFLISHYKVSGLLTKITVNN